MTGVLALMALVGSSACTKSEPKPTPQSETERADVAETSSSKAEKTVVDAKSDPKPTPAAKPAIVPACSGPATTFSYRYQTGTIPKRHSYTISGKPAGDGFAVEYSWKGWPRQLDKGGVELTWKGKLEGEQAERVRELLAGDVRPVSR